MKYQHTEAHKALLETWAAKWIANAMSTEAMSDREKELCRAAVFDLYRIADKPAPLRVVFAPSIMVGAIAWGIAAGVMELQEHPETFDVSADVVLASAESAIARITKKRPYLTEHVRTAVLAVLDLPSFEANGAAPDSKVEGWMVSLPASWSNAMDGGKDWSSGPSEQSFYAHIAQHDPENAGDLVKVDFTKWEPYERLAIHSGPRMMHAKFTIVCDRQLTIKVDDQSRPHSERGPAIEWRCGHKAYYWHGLAVPGEWLEAPEKLDVKVALTWDNIEQRRCAAEIIGWERVLRELNAKTLDENPNVELGMLLEVQLPDVGRQLFLRYRCGTGRWFSQPVPDTVTTAVAAQEWIWRKPAGGYTPEVRT